MQQQDQYANEQLWRRSEMEAALSRGATESQSPEGARSAELVTTASLVTLHRDSSAGSGLNGKARSGRLNLR